MIILTESPGQIEAIFITKDKKVYVTDGIKSKIKITNAEYKSANKGS
jgi:thiamine biosynthesis lipoprotein